MITLKFDLGKELFYIYKKNNGKQYVDCPTCEGEGTLFSKHNNEVKCPFCKGDGFIVNYLKRINKSKSFTASKITIDEFETIYTDELIKLSESDIFATEDEAQAECDRLNAQDEKL